MAPTQEATNAGAKTAPIQHLPASPHGKLRSKSLARKKSDMRSVLQLDFEHVLPCHASPVMGDAKSRYRLVLEGKLEGCQER